MENNENEVGVSLKEYNMQRKKLVMQKNPLVSCTPVMAGVRLQDLPPETPFLQSDGQKIVNHTPILRRFNVQGSDNSA